MWSVGTFAAAERADSDDRIGAGDRGALVRVDESDGVPTRAVSRQAKERVGLRLDPDRVQLEEELEPGGSSSAAEKQE